VYRIAASAGGTYGCGIRGEGELLVASGAFESGLACFCHPQLVRVGVLSVVINSSRRSPRIGVLHLQTVRGLYGSGVDGSG
jgi:hypothetical protein